MKRTMSHSKTSSVLPTYVQAFWRLLDDSWNGVNFQIADMKGLPSIYRISVLDQQPVFEKLTQKPPVRRYRNLLTSSIESTPPFRNKENQPDPETFQSRIARYPTWIRHRWIPLDHFDHWETTFATTGVPGCPSIGSSIR